MKISPQNGVSGNQTRVAEILKLAVVGFGIYATYPTRMRAIGTGAGSAWLRLGSSAGPMLMGFVMSSMGIQYVFATFAVILIIGAVVTMLFAVETKGKVLEELSP
ncbi:sugar transport protein [Rhizobium sp. UGM030330-04]|nr:sugar transport protein [Rhizobium sp. UGM030330-04]